MNALIVWEKKKENLRIYNALNRANAINEISKINLEEIVKTYRRIEYYVSKGMLYGTRLEDAMKELDNLEKKLSRNLNRYAGGYF